MKVVYTIIKLVILLILLTFAVINTQRVEFYYLPGEQFNLPLIVVLFIAFVVGVILGLLALFTRLFSLRAENSRLRKEIKKQEKLNQQNIEVATHPIQNDGH